MLLAIRYKGLKKYFSNDPIDYKSLRKEDIHEPPSGFLKNKKWSQFKILDTTINCYNLKDPNDHLVLFIHGGAYVYGPVSYHWDAVERISKTTNCNSWLVDYPKAPENKIDIISNNIDAVFKKASEEFESEKIILIGDSVGGSLIISLTQRLIESKISSPEKIILISPVLDASFSNPEVEQLNKKDPILSSPGVKSAKLICSNNYDLEDSKISPINGSFNRFPPTVFFLAEKDITFPDQKLALQRMKDSGVNVKEYIGKGMPHIWPILPVLKEGKAAFKKIIGEIQDTLEGN